MEQNMLSVKQISNGESSESKNHTNGSVSKRKVNMVLSYSEESGENEAHMADLVAKNIIANKHDRYTVLGATPSDLVKDIKRKYRKLAFMYHPDKNRAPYATEVFKIISNAFLEFMELLKDKNTNSDEPSVSRKRTNISRDLWSPQEIFEHYFGEEYRNVSSEYEKDYNKETRRHRYKGTREPRDEERDKKHMFYMRYSRYGCCGGCCSTFTPILVSFLILLFATLLSFIGLN